MQRALLATLLVKMELVAWDPVTKLSVAHACNLLTLAPLGQHPPSHHVTQLPFLGGHQPSCHTPPYLESSSPSLPSLFW